MRITRKPGRSRRRTMAAVAVLGTLFVGLLSNARPAAADDAPAAGDPALESYSGTVLTPPRGAEANVPTTPLRCADNGGDESHTRAEVLTRARTWLDVGGVPYSQLRCYRNQYGDYRTDCSGYVSMAWGLGGRGDVFWTGNILDRASVIARSSLQPADALWRNTGNEHENHIALFVRWADSAHTRPVVWEQRGGDGTVESEWSSSNASLYTPIRYDNIRDGDSTKNDFDGDGYGDYGIYRQGNGKWSVHSFHKGADVLGLTPYGGDSSDVPVTADIDGDGATDIGVYRAGNGTWAFKSVKKNAQIMGFTAFGGDASDIPVVGDFNGDGYDDYGIYRKGSGQWSLHSFHGDYDILGLTAFGGDQSDLPVVGDFDGDGADDIGVYRSGNGKWSFKSVKKNAQIMGFTAFGGDATDLPVVGDFNGDGYDDYGIYRSGNGQWSLHSFHGDYDILGLTPYGGDFSDYPVVGDYDGDGATDIGVYRAGNGTWALKSVRKNAQIMGFTAFGGDQSDLPIGRPFGTS